MSDGSIQFHSINIEFSLQNPSEISEWLNFTISKEGLVQEQLDISFMSDDDLLHVNKTYLKHDFYTDVITFEYNEGNRVSGDILISLDRVKENAKELSVNFADELHRVMIHGVLHLCGYKDKTGAEQVEMRSKEDYYLSLRSF